MNRSFKQRQKTVHLAICYLDKMLEQPDLFTRRFDDGSFFRDNHLLPLSMNEHLLATTCLLLASKFYEIDDNLIISTDVQTKFRHKGKFLYQEYQRAEIQVLLYLKWDAHITTVIDILSAFGINGVLQHTDMIKMDSKAEVKSLSQVNKSNHETL